MSTGPALGRTRRIPLHRLRLQPNLPAGLNLLRVASIADELRNVGCDVREPVRVRRLGKADWLVLDGRHRFIASYVAGCRDLLCIEDELP